MLDEPASGLTAEEVADLQSLILSFFAMTAMAIPTTSSTSCRCLFGISERVMVMDFGRKLVEGTPGEVARDPRVIDAYLGGQSEATRHALAWLKRFTAGYGRVEVLPNISTVVDNQRAWPFRAERPRQDYPSARALPPHQADSGESDL